MSDKELLELAAKAISFGNNTFCWNEPLYVGERLVKHGGLWDYVGGSPLWNPLTDDGDALRLAVKLDIEIYQAQDDPEIGEKNLMRVYAGYAGANGVIRFCIESCGDAPYAATRRAIVRAAAEIGKATSPR